MKKLSLLLVLLLVFVFTVKLSAQATLSLLEKGTVFTTSGEINLEDTYVSTPYKISFMVGNDDDVSPNQTLNDKVEKTGLVQEGPLIEIYNEDMSLDKTLYLRDLDIDASNFVNIESAKYGDKRFYITQSLFNDDDLFEFIVLGEKYFAVVNEKGKILFKENFRDDFVLGSDFSVFLFETSSLDNTYLFVELSDIQWNYTTTMYKINKNYSSGVESMPQLTKIKSYPNPVKDYITVNYDLGTALSGFITFVDLQGKEVLRKTVDNTNTSCRLSLRALKSGIYVMNVSAGEKVVSSERIIVK